MANGWSVIPQTPEQQAARADVVVVAEVVLVEYDLVEGSPVTLLRLMAVDTIRGNVPSGLLTMGLPGGVHEGVSYDMEVGDYAAGDVLLVFGDVVSPTTIQMLAGPQSVFRRVEENGLTVGATALQDPVVGFDCSRAPYIARPLSEAPLQVEAPPFGVCDDIADPPDRTFAENPLELGMSWEELLVELEDCIQSVPASPGALPVVGGAW